MGVEAPDQLAALGRSLQQILLASFGLHPEDVQREVTDAVKHLGGDNVEILLADYDQRVLVPYDADDDREFPIDGSAPGVSFRTDTVIAERGAGGRRRLWVPIRDSSEREGVLGVDDDGTIENDVWHAVASLVGELIASKEHYGDHVTLRKRRTPFSTPAEMRWGMQPPLTFTSPDVTLAGFLQPTHSIAGDAFDYSVTGRRAYVLIVDAMGHGLEASRMANLALGASRNARRNGASLTEIVVALDEAIETQFGDSRFVTGQVATLDLDTGGMELVNFGHPLPLLLCVGQPVEEIECPPAQPAGLGSDPTVTKVQLRPGDSVLFRTDGIVDARSPSGDVFSDEALTDLLRELTDAGLPPSEVLRQVVHAVVRHRGDRDSDDATMLLMAWKRTDL